MPRKVTTFPNTDRSLGANPAAQKLRTRLARELRSRRETGQPLIWEKQFPTGLASVTVIWDEWERLSPPDRSTVILQAYEQVEGATANDRVTLMDGLTPPEAQATGMLPFEVRAGLRKTDPLTPKQIHAAMIKEGASLLFDAKHPRLFCPTEEDAAAAIARLSQRLPGSEPIWLVVPEARPMLVSNDFF